MMLPITIIRMGAVQKFSPEKEEDKSIKEQFQNLKILGSQKILLGNIEEK